MRVRLMRASLAAVLLLLPAVAAADGPPIRITINPEARVSVAIVGALPASARCGTPVEFPIAIVNQGFVTAALEAELVGDSASAATLDFHPEPLKGVPAETRVLRITLRKPGTVDLTIAFRAHSEIPDLGGRDRIHFLISAR
jgi:hypothetical protein